MRGNQVFSLVLKILSAKSALEPAHLRPSLAFRGRGARMLSVVGEERTRARRLINYGQLLLTAWRSL